MTMLTSLDLESEQDDYANLTTIGVFADSIALHTYNSDADSRSAARLRFYFDD